MAQSELIIKITYENNVSFQMTAKENSENTAVTIVKMDENNHFVETWASVKNICETYFRNKLDDIGSVMRA